MQATLEVSCEKNVFDVDFQTVHAGCLFCRSNDSTLMPSTLRQSYWWRYIFGQRRKHVIQTSRHVNN